MSDLGVRYGSVAAVRGVSFEAHAGEVLALTGPNGAGKTSILEAIAGHVGSTGEVSLDGRRVDGLAADRRARAGIALVSEGRRLFGRLTVQQNLVVATVTLPRRAARDAVARALDAFPLLRALAAQPAATLSGGEAQVLAIARALVAAPRAVLVDEPLQGLSEESSETVLRALRRAAEDGAAVVVASPEPQPADRALRIEHGRVLAEAEA